MEGFRVDREGMEKRFGRGQVPSPAAAPAPPATAGTVRRTAQIRAGAEGEGV
jgi:hypothetical protein